MTSSSCSVCPISLTLLSSLPLSRHTKTSLKSTAHLVSSSSLSNCWNPPDVWLSTTTRCLRSGNDSSWMLPGSAPFRDGNASDRSLTYSELRIRGTTNRWLTPTSESVETCGIYISCVNIGILLLSNMRTYELVQPISRVQSNQYSTYACTCPL